MSTRLRFALAIAALSVLVPSSPLSGQAGASYDIVIRGGRVIDPETGFDAIADVGIRGGRVIAVAEDGLVGDRMIEADGLVVAPGFIDPLTSVGAALMPGARYKVTDGVTTVLSLHGGPVFVDSMYARLEEMETLLNYGTNFGHGSARAAVGLSASDEGERLVSASRSRSPPCSYWFPRRRSARRPTPPMTS